MSADSVTESRLLESLILLQSIPKKQYWNRDGMRRDVHRAIEMLAQDWSSMNGEEMPKVFALLTRAKYSASSPSKGRGADLIWHCTVRLFDFRGLYIGAAHMYDNGRRPTFVPDTPSSVSQWHGRLLDNEIFEAL
ncbi:hypothetical protein CPB83DRAFT_900329 [Crepidotus variabilis]|uniref:Uncharacterized protein n=1 Tax=Crepidotus variabilis TaxID=179855 RepID=A0A9P6E3C1_9AGAR|nr:hypothetical protein CPB83DRAFT_900329 [Crepidotus variabilis]